jgi:hypothetical protein
MRFLPGRSGAFRVGLLLTLIGLLTSLAAMLGCRKRQEPPTATGGAIYYTGPRVKKGGGMSPGITK